MRLVDVIRRSGTGAGSQSTPSQAGAAASQSNVLRVEAPGQRSRVVTSEADGLEALAAVCRQRMVATTGANAESSRSHLLLSFRLGANGNGPRLVLADLAGSERLPPDASLERQRESSAINSSLSALGRCVATLASDPSPTSSASSSSTSSSEVFVPFRESKLTRLLQDSLGGGSYVLLVATLSASEAPSESVSTMRFASRLRSMQLRPTTTVSAPAPAFTSPVAAPAPSSPQSPLPAPALRLVARKKGERVALTTPERRLRSKLAARLADASPGTLLDLLAASAASAVSATEAAPKQPLPFSPTSRQPAGLAATPKTPTAAARPAAAAAAPPARTPTTYDMHGRRVQTTPQQQHSQQRPRALTALGGGL
jgi:Kinesin motor domain